MITMVLTGHCSRLMTSAATHNGRLLKSCGAVVPDFRAAHGGAEGYACTVSMSVGSTGFEPRSGPVSSRSYLETSPLLSCTELDTGFAASSRRGSGTIRHAGPPDTEAVEAYPSTRPLPEVFSAPVSGGHHEPEQGTLGKG